MIRPTPSVGSNAAVSSWLWAIGTACLVFAARSREIHLHAGPTPYLDQWRIEAELIIVPWLQDQLSWTAFFAPHHEHVPLWTRVFAWLQAALLGRWDSQLQCTINAFFWAGTVGLWCHRFHLLLPRVPAAILSALAVALAALPHGWENSTWGFQSHLPLALLFVTWHVYGAFTWTPFTARWWCAQGAGLAALFTLGSMWAAPFAVLLVLLWTGEFDRRRWLPAGLLALLGVGMLLLARHAQPHTGALAQTAVSPHQLLAAFLVHLGWPSAWPAAAGLLQLPLVLLAWRLFRRPTASAFDRMVLAVGLWSVAQAAAFALARGGGGWLGFVSRYGDLLALGVLANAVALWRLLQALPGWRPGLAVLALVWSVALFQGLQWVSTRGHTEYFHQHSALWALFRRDAVQQYLTTRSLDRLETVEVRNLLYPDPRAVAAILDTPGLADLLPVQLRPQASRKRGDFISAVATRTRALWPVIASTGLVLVLLSVALPGGRSGLGTPPLVANPGPSPMRPLGLLSLGATGLLFLWSMPFEFKADKRWRKLLTPPGYVGELSFRITTPTTYAVDNLTGGAGLWPEDFRNTFYGTHIDGPGFTGSARSSSFPLQSPWLLIPIAGFPSSPSNSISLQVEELDGRIVTQITCTEPNPASIAFWCIDTRAYAGRQGRIIFQDGRTDAEGWVAAAAPQPATNPYAGERLNAAWQQEQTTGAHRSIGLMALFLIVATAWAAWTCHRHSRKESTPHVSR